MNSHSRRIAWWPAWLGALALLAGAAQAATLSCSTNGSAIMDLGLNSGFTFSVVTQPQHGTISITSIVTSLPGETPIISRGRLTFTATPGYTGPDSFVYKQAITSSGLTVAQTSVDVSVTKPTATSGDSRYPISVSKNGPTTRPLIGADAQNDPITFALATQAGHGTAAIHSTGSFTYTPQTNYAGTDSFTFTVTDGLSTSSAGTVYLLVEAPVAVGNSLQYPLHVSKNRAASGPLNGYDPQNDAITFAAASGPASGALTIAPNGQFTYTPNNGFAGTDSFTFTVADAWSTSTAATIFINVSAPVPTSNSSANPLSISKNRATVGQVTGYDAQSDPLTFAASSAPAHGSVSLGANGGFTYTPQPGYVGDDSFAFTVSDGAATSAAAVFYLRVEAPLADSVPAFYPFSVSKNRAYQGRLTGQDPQGDPITFAVSTQPSHGTVAVSPDGAFTYTPQTVYAGPDSFSFTVADAWGASTPATVALVVSAPVATSGSEFYPVSISKNRATQGTLTGQDPQFDPITFAAASQPAHGSVSVASGGVYTYTPLANYTGPDAFTFTVSDGASASAPATIYLVVAAPVADGNPALYPALISMNRPTTGVVTGSDPQGDAITFAVGTPPAHGSLTLNANGSYTYTPQTDYVGTDSFTFAASDSWGASAPATIHLSVLAPYGWSAPGSMALVSGATFASKASESLMNRTIDPQGDAKTVALHRAPDHGEIAIAPDGRFSYAADFGYSGADSFEWTVSDSWGTSSPVTETVQVHPWRFSATFDKEAGHFDVNFDGLPGTEYVIQSSLDLRAWREERRAVSDGQGRIRVTVTPAGGLANAGRFLIRVLAASSAAIRK